MTKATTIAVVSGKGGVGKTMLSVAIANELSRSKKVLLLDLDFFNRGLTGLLSSLQPKSPGRDINPFSFETETENQNWSVNEVANRLFMVFFGDLEKQQLDAIEQRNTQALADDLRCYIEYLIAEIDVDFVVLDCHGGPDNTSFAACAFADRSILVSEPDRITLHGTLNFLRQLRQHVPESACDIRLVFNKVVTAFSSTFLFRFYTKYLRTEFDGRDLLAIIPLEIYLTKAFEKMPFLTTAYPYSQLANKSRLAIFDLFATTPDVELPPQIAAMTRIERFFARYYMGRWPNILNLDFALKVIAIFALLGFGAPLIINLVSLVTRGRGVISDQTIREIGDIAIVGLGVGAVWALILIWLNWTRDFDSFFTYASRTRSTIKATIGWLVLTALCVVASFMFGVVLRTLLFETSADISLWITIVAGIGIPLAFYIVLSVWRGARNIRFDHRYFESCLRFTFAAICIGTALVSTLFETL